MNFLFRFRVLAVSTVLLAQNAAIAAKPAGTPVPSASAAIAADASEKALPTPCPACGLFAPDPSHASTAASGTGTASSTLAVNASPSPAAQPVVKSRAQPFKSKVVSVNKRAHTFTMGKKKIHVVHVNAETKLLKGNETPASFDDLVVGAEIRGAYHKRADGDVEAVSLKIGPKSATPVAAVDEDSL